MKYLNRFNNMFLESSSQKILTEEEITDYLLEYVDTKDLTFSEVKTGTGIWDSTGSYLEKSIIEIIYLINTKYINIKDVQTLEEFGRLMLAISGICKRWKLNFKLYNGGFTSGGGSGCQLTITQIAPKYITDFIKRSYASNIHPWFTQKLSGWQGVLITKDDYKFSLYFGHVVNKEMEFFLYCKIELGTHSSWNNLIDSISRKEKKNFMSGLRNNDKESEIIIANEIKEIIISRIKGSKLEFVSREPKSKLHEDIWIFKILP